MSYYVKPIVQINPCQYERKYGVYKKHKLCKDCQLIEKECEDDLVIVCTLRSNAEEIARILDEEEMFEFLLYDIENREEF